MNDPRIYRFDCENPPSKQERAAIEAVFEEQDWNNPKGIIISAFLKNESVGILTADLGKQLAHIVKISQIAEKLGVATQMHAEFEKISDGRWQTADTAPYNNKAKFFFTRMGYQPGDVSTTTGLLHFFKPATKN
ncbi:hypothetical protein K9N08_04760 [Candidatus Gracilibacteria bacterium]|nr:hypothetical protein [Candidatus Gracilibacteria bacterium]MCF7856817.1 hypothetical protein [Candidatus Gracilibacteria bacterium]